MEPTDIQLMLRVQKGDMEAYRILVQRYRGPLRRFLAAMLPDSASAEDAVQETLLRLWLLRERYEPRGKFSTYLFQIARHHALNERKRQKAYSRGNDFVTAAVESPELTVLRDERAEIMEAAIRKLPPIYQTVFVLSQLHGLKYAEIGARLDIPVGTVKSRMAEAVRRLRLHLSIDQSEESV